MSYKKTTIGLHCTVTSSKRFHASERTKEGVPFYCSKEIIKKVNGEEVTECDYISEDAYNRVKEEYGAPQTGDLLITTRGTYGVPYIYKEYDKFYFADGNLTWLKAFDDELDAEYLYYWINSYEGQKKIDAIAKGTAQKAVPIASLKQIEIVIPENAIQKKVVVILKTYDELIENNKKQIKLLEEAAQRLYKEWFVDLRFPGYENCQIVDGVPEGWKNTCFSDLIDFEIGGGWGDEQITQKCTEPAYIIRGTDIEGITHGNYVNIPFRYHARSNLISRVLRDGDIVFEVSGGSKTEGVAKTGLVTNMLLNQFAHPVICASFCKKVRPVDGISYFLFYTFQYMRKSGKTAEYDKKSASSIVNYRWKDFLIKESVILPPEDILRKYNELAINIYSLIQANSIVIENAKEARDCLLPKLMSGEIEV